MTDPSYRETPEAPPLHAYVSTATPGDTMMLKLGQPDLVLAFPSDTPEVEEEGWTPQHDRHHKPVIPQPSDSAAQGASG